MNKTERLDGRLRRFVSGADDADWHDVLGRAGEVPKRRTKRVLRRRLVLALACFVVAVTAAGTIFSGVFSSSQPRQPTGLGPLAFSPLDMAFTRDASGNLMSIQVTVNAATRGGTALLQVVQGQINPQDATTNQIVFQERVPMRDVTPSPNGPPGTVVQSSWSGTLSPSDWSGGCQSGGSYGLAVRVSPTSNPTVSSQPGQPASGEYVVSGGIVCSSTN